MASSHVSASFTLLLSFFSSRLMTLYLTSWLRSKNERGNKNEGRIQIENLCLYHDLSFWWCFVVSFAINFVFLVKKKDLYSCRNFSITFLITFFTTCCVWSHLLYVLLTKRIDEWKRDSIPRLDVVSENTYCCCGQCSFVFSISITQFVQFHGSSWLCQTNIRVFWSNFLCPLQSAPNCAEALILRSGGWTKNIRDQSPFFEAEGYFWFFDREWETE